MSSSNSFILIVIAMVLLQMRERKVKPWKLMILSVFMLFITSLIVQSILFTSLLNFSLITTGFIIGVLIGIAVGSFMAVIVDEDGVMTSHRIFIYLKYRNYKIDRSTNN